MAGHSKWANIKHRKARVDAQRGKLWSKCSRAIIVAAKNGGGDPAANLTLRYAIEEAKAANMPKDTIERAVKKGAGELDGESYEDVRYEGYGPGGVAVIVDCLTDNRNRTAPEMRLIFGKYGGNLGATGCVSYMFEQKGVITIEKDKAPDEERMMDLAIEAGAEDAALDGDTWTITTAPADFLTVKEAIDNAGVEAASASITMEPNNTVEVRGGDAKRVLALYEALEDNDDVQKVYANFDIPDEELAELG
ncbi:MAG: YebC/PmpR family DNA-binding transcriptional regulator [Phycisphaeraceae bacterium]|nr:MAG: YebC/PmpR family DNA-binding transcriptional regulator [Phycisphaeraceae bacterium]